jgi:hypothetical protein
MLSYLLFNVKTCVLVPFASSLFFTSQSLIFHFSKPHCKLGLVQPTTVLCSNQQALKAPSLPTAAPTRIAVNPYARGSTPLVAVAFDSGFAPACR